MDFKNHFSFGSKLQYQMLLAMLVVFHSYFGIYKGINIVKSDFPNYYVSANLLKTDDLAIAYNDSLFQNEVVKIDPNIHARFSLYPPSNAFLLLFLNAVSIYSAKNIWLVFSVACTFLSIFFFSRLARLEIHLSAIIFLLSGFNLSNDFYLGQVYSFLLMLTLCGIYCLARHPILSAFLLSVVASLKFITLGFVLLFVRKKYFRNAVFFTLFFIAITILSAYLGGLQVFFNYVSQRFIPLSIGNVFNELPFAVQYQSVISLLTNIFVYDAVQNPNPVFSNCTNYYLVSKYLFYGIMFCVLMFNLSWLISKKINACEFLSLSIMILLLLESGSATYHLLFLIPILAYILANVNFISSQKIMMVFMFAAIGFVPTLLNIIFDVSYLPFALKYMRLILLITYFCFVQFLYFQLNKKIVAI